MRSHQSKSLRGASNKFVHREGIGGRIMANSNFRNMVPAFLAVAFLMLGQAAMAKSVITEVFVFFDGSGQPEKIRIEGLDFGSDPLVEIGNFTMPLTIAEPTCVTPPTTAPIQCLVADLPAGTEAGDFQLSLTNPSIAPHRWTHFFV